LIGKRERGKIVFRNISPY